MKTNKRTNPTGFGIQRDITDDGAVLYLRITNPRRLNTKSLGEVLVRYLQGGFETLILDQGPFKRQKMKLVEFLGRLQASFNEGQLLFFERKLNRDRVSF
jgi:hypothetical protein